jgi:hypothetical protein
MKKYMLDLSHLEDTPYKCECRRLLKLVPFSRVDDGFKLICVCGNKYYFDGRADELLKEK